jgi:putative inorganic carbon (HCO3(-)) transporter
MIFLIPNKWFINLIIGMVFIFLNIFSFFREIISNLYSSIVDQARLVIWINSFEIIKLVPFTGIGLGNFPIVYKYLFEKEFIHAHNIFLNIAIELGIPGLILFVALAFSLIYYGIIYAKRQKDPFFYAVNVGLVSVVFGFLVRCLVDYTI